MASKSGDGRLALAQFSVIYDIDLTVNRFNS